VAFYDALTDAAFDGKPARLKKLIAQADPALFKKATQPESVKALYRRRTPLMLATMGAHAACVKQLAPLSNASDRDCDGETALTLLAEYQSGNNEKAVIESLRALLEHSSVADVNAVAKSAARESTALSNAIARGRVSVAGLLLAAGADATLRKASGETPLMQAASRGLPRLVKMLLPLSDPQAKDHEGDTALSMAIRSHRPEAREKACVKLLLEKGRPEGRLPGGKTLLMVCSGEFIASLLPFEDPFVIDDNGLSALFHAAARGDAMAVAALAPRSDTAALASMRDPQAKKNALSMAAQVNGECVRLLLPFFDPNEANPQGRTALMEAARKGNWTGTRLLAKVSDVNRLDAQGYSALALAVNGGKWETARELTPLSDPQTGRTRALDPKGEPSINFGLWVEKKGQAAMTVNTRPWALAMEQARRGDWAGVEMLADAIPLQEIEEWAKEGARELQEKAPKLFARMEAEQLRRATPSAIRLAAEKDREPGVGGVGDARQKRRPRSL